MTAARVCDIPADDYHATEALSSTGIKLLLPPSCPAKYRWALENPPPPKDVFDLGTAAHALVLGTGPKIEVIDADDWRTKAAKEARDYARQAGRVPLLARDHDRVTAMAVALLDHPLARVLFDPAHGKPEQSVFWDDPEFGISCKARFDWLPDLRRGRMTIPDYKTTDGDAHPDALRKTVGNYGYHIQHAWYCAAAEAAGLADDPAFVFVFQEKNAPYLVNVVQLDGAAIQSGRDACRAAAEIYRDCTTAGVWPGYPPDIPAVSLPPWATRIPEDFYQ